MDRRQQRRRVDMGVSARAIEHLEATAQSVGFGQHNDDGDMPFLSQAAVSIGSWKGTSVAACSFAHEGQAREYLDRVLPDLDGLGSDALGAIVPIYRDDIGDFGCVVVITAMFLVHTDDLAAMPHF